MVESAKNEAQNEDAASPQVSWRSNPLRVLVMFPESDEIVARLRTVFPEHHFNAVVSYEEAAPFLAKTHVFLGTGVGLTAELLAAMPNLLWIQCVISGTNQFIPALDGRPELLVTSARGIHGPQMTEMAILHMLALSRRVRPLQLNQTNRTWTELPQQTLDSKTVTIVGLGATGERLATICKALNMTVQVVSDSGRTVVDVDHLFNRADLGIAVQNADFVVSLIPMSSETAGIFGREVFAAMKRSAYFINLARGGVADEGALIDALQSGEIAGAGLDVFTAEPLASDSPLWNMDSVFITPHLAGRSDRYVEQLLSDVVIPNLSAFTMGEDSQLVNVVKVAVPR